MEDLLIKIGGIGRYQGFLLFFVFLTAFTCATNYYSQLFSLLEPPKSCMEESLDGCHVVLGRDNNISECTAWNYNYSDQFPTLVSEANWVCEKDALPKIITTVFWIGNAIGSVIFGISNDLLGRKATILMSHGIYFIGTAMTLFFTNIFEYQVVARLLIGMAHHTVAHLPYLLAVEFCTQKTRAVPLLVMMIAYSSSSILLPLLAAYYIQHWTHLVYISLALTATSILVIPILPESLSWLACVGKKEKFQRVLSKIRKMNGQHEEGGEEINKMLSEIFKPSSGSTKKPSIVDLKMYKRLCLNCIMIIVVCCSCFMCYYGHVQNTTNLGGSIYFNFTFGALVEVGAWATPFIVNKCGRRYVMAILLLLSGLCSISHGFAPLGFDTYKLVIALAGRVFITGAYNISLMYASEIFPTEIRGKGMAICEFVGGFGIILSPSIIYLRKYGSSIPMTLFGIISIMAGFVSCCLPETGGTVMVQTMEEGNEFGKQQSLFPCMDRKNTKKESATFP